MDMGYDMIVGRDLLRELGIVLDFQNETIGWEGASIPMKPHDSTVEDSFHVQDGARIAEATERMKKILDAKYEPANLEKIVEDSTHLTKDEQQRLYRLLNKYKTLFDGTLGKWADEEYDIELKEGVTPYHAKPFPIPKAYEQTLRMEIQRLVDAGVLKERNRSTWAAPTFIIPKKDKTVRFISDFRELNKRIKRKPFPLPKIQDIMLKLEGFQYATSLDLNMGYYHIELSPTAKQLCTIVMPWGKYEYQRLPMGLCNSPDIFQEKMSSLMRGLEFVRTYIDDILCLTCGTWDDHLNKLETVLQRLCDAGLKVNAKKSFFGRPELEYLGYWITRNGIQPIPKKIEAIQKIAPPKTKKQVRSFIGMVNHYRDMWPKRSETLAPLTELCASTVPHKWTEEHNKAFEKMKQIMSKEVLLVYPNFTKPFNIHTDASHTQLGAVISQEGKTIDFYSRKLAPAQTRYTTTERELLSIVETLKEFRNILLGQKIRVYTDHQNLTYKNFNTERVMRWRLILEEYGPELHYIKGTHNVVADALSRLPLTEVEVPDGTDEVQMAEFFGDTKEALPENIFPVKFKTIRKLQRKDKELIRKLEHKDAYTLKSFRGGDRDPEMLICKNDKIVVPEPLQKRMVEWYHTMLCHPGETRTEESIKQHFYWKNVDKTVHKICKKCDSCQRTKKGSKKYGHLPEKEAEVHPWEHLCVDLIGPYTLKRKGKKPLTLWAVTMIDPATGWFEMAEISCKESIYIANKVEQVWFTRYPWPVKVTFDRGSEFMSDFAQMVQEDLGLKKKPTTVKNPQENAILEIIHQTLGNIIRTFEMQEVWVDEKDPWSGPLAAAMFATRATYHTTLQATPAQLVFGRDAILNTMFEANWSAIKARKQRIIRKSNVAENKNRIPHDYSEGDQVLLNNEFHKAKYGTNPWLGPYEVTQVNNNGTVRLRRGVITDTVNIRNIKPYHS